MPAPKVRKSVPVTAEDQHDIERLRGDAAYREAYTAATGHDLPDKPSEAEALHALIEVGRSALKERVLLSGYAALAAAQDDEDRQLEAARRSRRPLRVRD
jgi:hypothetical protein